MVPIASFTASSGGKTIGLLYSHSYQQLAQVTLDVFRCVEE